MAVAAVLLAALTAGGMLRGTAVPRPAVKKKASHPVHLMALTPYVNPFIGTFGNGNVFPGASLPFGMVQWSPDTGPSGITRPGGYFFGDAHITGFPLTHLSGAGCVAFDDIPFMPTIKPLTVSPVVNGYPYSARFSHAQERATPGYYGVVLNSGIRVQLTATARTGLARVTYPASRAATVLIDVGGSAGPTSNANEAADTAAHIAGPDTVTGWATSGHFCGLHNTYTIYFAARFSRPFVSVGTWSWATMSPGSRRTGGPHAGAWVTFDATQSRSLEVKVGVSFVSVQNALLNLQREDPGWSFPAVRERARAVWNRRLNRIQVSGGSPGATQVFYTALYHALLQPTVFGDVDGQYIGFDNKVHVARGYTQYANFSGWDIYRSEVPLLAWLAPRQTGDMMQSLVADATQGGWLPKWPIANDYTGEMNGDSADPIIADAIAFGATGFDLREALRLMVKGATRPGRGREGYEERPGLADYLRLGYVPPETGGYGSAATTLEYAIDDFAIARTAAALGDGATYRTFIRRARSWRRVFNPATGFVEPLFPNGTFPTPFDPTSMDGFVEGDSWQYSWMVPQDLGGLIRAMGGPDRVCRRLDRFFTQLNTGPDTPYDWAGNEPGLEVPWEYDVAGCPWRTQAVVRRIMTQLYPPRPWGLPGNDDLGTMSAWYVWAALGLYPEIPGVAVLAVGSPLFRLTTIRPPEGLPTAIAAPAASDSTPYVRALELNGRPHARPWISLRTLQRGATLRFRLGSTPGRAWGGTATAPPPAS